MASETRPKPTAIQTNPASLTPAPSSSNDPPASVPLKKRDFPQVIPDVESHKGRNLILCFDGTGDQFDQDNSNVVRFVQLLKKDDRSKQMVYYQAGIGTGVGLKRTGVFTAKASQVIDAAIATGLSFHVKGGYEFLMQNYTEGDKISLFGFSRGAYTARALAGMLHKVGLLPAYNHEQVPFAYAMFKRDDEEGWKMSNGFKRAFSVDVKIDFLGVFDTVNSVGIIPRELPFARSNYLVRVFRHAVALDERRAKFKANLWGRATVQEEKLGEAGKRKVYKRTKKGSGIWSFVTSIGESDHDKDGKHKHEEHEDERSDEKHVHSASEHRNGHDFSSAAERGHETDVKEVWFAGAHCDVGGGSVSNETLNNLARIPLRWMVRECFLNNTGILFHSAELDEIGISPATLWPVVKIPTPPPEEPSKYDDVDTPGGHLAEPTGSTLVSSPIEEGPKPLVPKTRIKLGCEEDMKDALMPVYDQLSMVKWWWILEVLPSRQRYQRHDKSWSSRLSVNLGGPRVIHGQKRFPIYVHRSVQYRMQQLGYKPRALLLENPGPVWVD